MKLPEPPLRWILGSVATLLLAGLAIVITASSNDVDGWIWWLSVGSLYLLALVGLWRRVRWGWHLSQWMSLYTMMILIGWSLPTPNTDQGIIRPGHVFSSASTGTLQASIAVIALITIAIVALLIRQQDQFRRSWW